MYRCNPLECAPFSILSDKRDRSAQPYMELIKLNKRPLFKSAFKVLSFFVEIAYTRRYFRVKENIYFCLMDCVYLRILFMHVHRL